MSRSQYTHVYIRVPERVGELARAPITPRKIAFGVILRPARARAACMCVEYTIYIHAHAAAARGLINILAAQKLMLA